MSLVAVGVVVGTPNTTGEVPITVSNLAQYVVAAQGDLATLATAIGVVQSNASAADTDVGTVVTDATTTQSAANTSVTNATTADTNVGTTGTDFDAFAAALIAITGDTYNSTTKQFTFGGATGITHAQLAGALGTALNLVGSDQVTAKAATATAKTQATTVQTDANTTVTDANTAKTATALTKTNANALSTATVAGDLTTASTLIGTTQVFIQTDTSHAPNIATLNGALVGALGFMRDTSILPT